MSFCVTLFSAANEYNNGVVMTNRPLKDSELFEIRITDMIDKWAGSIEVGITAHRPDTMELPATMTTLQNQTWVMSGASIVSGGKTLKENYGTSLDSLRVRIYYHVPLYDYQKIICVIYLVSMDHNITSNLLRDAIFIFALFKRWRSS